MLSLRSCAFVLLLLTLSFNLFCENSSTPSHSKSELLQRASEQPLSTTVLTAAPCTTEQLTPLARIKQYCVMTIPNPVLSGIMLAGTILALQQENFFIR